MRMIGLATVAGILWLLAACSATPPTTPVPTPSTLWPTEIPTAREQRKVILDAYALLEEDDREGANRLLIAALAAPSFGDLSPVERNSVLVFAGYLALELHDPPRAHGYFKRSTSMKEATGDDWLGRLYGAYGAEDIGDAVASLTRLAKDWRATLAEVGEDLLFGVVRESSDLSDGGAARFNLLDALFETGWKTEDGREPSHFWVDLARLLLEQGNEQRAVLVASRVTSPLAIVALRVDHRFEPVVRALGRELDVNEASAAEIDRLRAFAKQSPRSLKALMHLGYSLLEARRYEEVLAISGDALARATADGGTPAYDDVDEYLVWIMDNRTTALKRLGRWDEAEAQQVHASRMLENGHPNVSQAINLAALFLDLERPTDALAAIAPVTDNVSGYGKMQIAAVQFVAALQMKSEESARQALAYLSGHRSDALSTYQEVLVEADDMTAAAELLVSRLTDPQLRSDALVDVQEFTRAPGTPRIMKQRGRWRTLLAREDVRAAIAKAGRIEKYDIETL